MSGNNFLENLKKAVDTGEFNSEAAKKINAIDEAANDAKGLTYEEHGKNAEKLLKAQAVTAEEAAELNSSYEEQMKKIKETDAMNKQLAMLIEIEEMVELSISDMVNHMDVIMETFEEEHEENNAVFEPLFTKVEEIRKKYSTFINK